MKLPKINFLGRAMKTWVNIFGQFVIMNMYLDLRHDSIDSGPLYTEYDFIVVGGGSAGGVVSSRLSDIGQFSVLLLEAGGDESVPTMVPWFHTQLPGSNLDWQFKTLPQEGILLGYEGQMSRWPRGKVLGGTSSFNTMLYMRGNRNDYDRWAHEGNYGWSYRDVLPYFLKSEHQTDPYLAKDTEYHGTGGPLVVSNTLFRTPIMRGFLEAGKYFGYPIRNPNGAFQSGFSAFQMTINQGKRWSTAQAYIRPASIRENFHISLWSHVHRILFDEESRAIGVEFTKNGKLHIVYCRKEIIISAGTVLSPQILMLSGIGPAHHLKSLGIPVISDLPVGRNLQDHVGAFGLAWTVPKGVAYSLTRLFNPLSLAEYKMHHTGVFGSTVGVEGNAFLHTGLYSNSSYGKDWPDIQLFFLSVTPAIDGGGTFADYLGISKEMLRTYYKPIKYREGISIVPVLLRPHSRGYIELKSRNPYHMPIIQPNYLKDRRDYEVLKAGLKLAVKIGNSPPFKKFGAKFHHGILPGCPTLALVPPMEEYWDCFIRHQAQTEHHVAGSCKMGPENDPESVVDPELRVYGVKGLRVIDGSIMPYVVSGNTNAPIIMIGEKGADLIKDTWLVSGDEVGHITLPFEPSFHTNEIVNHRTNSQHAY